MTEIPPSKTRVEDAASYLEAASADEAARHRIRVDVSASYVGEQSKPDESHYVFSYT
ncbi:MAG: hypothetical protein GX535_04575, partial [Xanthomonadaceae bacterium]|nr:hypothetical protein [Xanthomonadaceae bacterium]